MCVDLNLNCLVINSTSLEGVKGSCGALKKVCCRSVGDKHSCGGVYTSLYIFWAQGIYNLYVCVYYVYIGFSGSKAVFHPRRL